MKNTAISTYSANSHQFQLFDQLRVFISIKKNPFHLDVEELFQMAARMNKKRAFLFVSNILGKHLAVSPEIPLLMSKLLVYQLATLNNWIDEGDAEGHKIVQAFRSSNRHHMQSILEDGKKVHLPNGGLIIGFAETATALGHGVFDAFSNANFIHTTRESIPDLTPTITFQEEHSHAVDQICYGDAKLFQRKDQPIILVDDEMTSGKTTLNIIRSLHERFPRKQYIVLSILDWRTQENLDSFQELEKDLEIDIQCISLITGEFSYEGSSLEDFNEFIETKEQAIQYKEIDITSHFTRHQLPFIQETGRFGLDEKNHLSIKKAAEQIKPYRSNGNALCLGTGEFMYIPMKIATLLGDHIYYHSTTRSPIYAERREDYSIKERFTFQNPEDPNVIHHVYNIPQNFYEEAFLFFERRTEQESLQQLLSYLNNKGIHHIHVVYVS